MNFEINVILLLKTFALDDQKIKTKIQYSWEWKEFSSWNENHFSSYIEGFYAVARNYISSDLRVDFYEVSLTGCFLLELFKKFINE